jgi:hypothetical protein
MFSGVPRGVGQLGVGDGSDFELLNMQLIEKVYMNFFVYFGYI